MTKVVYNACFGGFGISAAGIERYAQIKGLTLYPEKEARFGFTYYWLVPPDKRGGVLSDDAFWLASMEARQASNALYATLVLEPREIARTDPALVQVVEELGDAANGEHAKLCVADVPTGERYRIDEYDGSESVMTVDSYEWQTA
jgi:hypothetical protein